MDFASFKMRYLESLSTAELAELADRNGLDIPPGFERVFIIGELLELERHGRRGAEEEPEEGEFTELAALPDAYGLPRIDVLVRDPLWVFAYWEPRRHPEGSEPAEPFLRVVPLRGEEMLPDGAASLTVAVAPGDRSLYLGIPAGEGRCFRVELCERRGEDRSVAAASRPFTLPKAFEPGAEGLSPLAVLSGAEGFPIARSVDRLSRLKGA